MTWLRERWLMVSLALSGTGYLGVLAAGAVRCCCSVRGCG